MGISLVISGCSKVETAEDQNGLNLMKTGVNQDDEDRDRGEQYFNQGNPSADNYIDATETRPNFGDDQEKIRDVVRTFEDVTPGSVIINGRNAYVTVHSNDNFNEEKRDKLRHKLLHSITKAVPRYHIHVRVHDGDGDR